MKATLTPAQSLPRDADRAMLVGRLWQPGIGPTLVALHQGGLHDITRVAPTGSELLEHADCAQRVRAALQDGSAPHIAALDAALRNSDETVRDATQPWLLAPCDLQVIKASGVTFVESLLERVIEEQARGDASKAEAIRAALSGVLGDNLAGIVPGSPQAAKVKEVLIAQGAWSQYLEVGIGPDAEIFTKAPVLSSVGTGADIGIHAKSVWNNPEPEVVLAVNSRGQTLGAALGNDVNLRDSRAAVRSCWARPRTTTPPAPSVPSYACSTRNSASRMCGASPWACACRGRRASCWKAAARCRRSAAIPWTSFRTPSARTTTTRTASCCSWAPCSRPRKTGTAPARASRMKWAMRC